MEPLLRRLPELFSLTSKLLYAGQFGHVSFFCFLFFHLFSSFPTTNGSLRSGHHTSTTTTVPVFRCAASRAVWRRRSCTIFSSQAGSTLQQQQKLFCLTTNDDDDAASDDRHTQDHDATKRDRDTEVEAKSKIKAEQRALEDRAICVRGCVWTRWCSEDPLFTALTIAASAR